MTNISPFEDNWLYPVVHESMHAIEWRLSPEAEERIRRRADWSLASLLFERDRAVTRLGSKLGERPYIALSGGVDSQAACLTMMQSGISFSVAILVFDDGLNHHDVKSAYEFCAVHGIEPIVVHLDILDFLSNRLEEYLHKYQCPSPQITAHLWFYEVLMHNYDASSIICGGNPPYYREGRVEFGSTRSQTSWMTFAALHDFPLIGNFLSYSLDMALPMLLATSDSLIDGYGCKVAGMKKLGLAVVPQLTKYTGFEKIKEHYQGITGDGWAFEKMFRHRYTKIVPEYSSTLQLKPEIQRILIEHALK